MAKTATTYRVVRLYGSSAQWPVPTREEIDEERLQEFQQMYRDAEKKTGSAETPSSDGNEESNDNDETGFDVRSDALYNNDLGQEIPDDKMTFMPLPPWNMGIIDFGICQSSPAQLEWMKPE